MKTDVIVVTGPASIRAVKRAMPSVPVVAMDLESDPVASGFVASLAHPGGKNVVIDWRYAQGGEDRLPGLAVELVRLKPDVIVADATRPVQAARRATSTIPIVMIGSAAAIGSGLVSSLARPGGNVTGQAILLAEMSAKRLQLLKEVIPKVSRVAVLWNPTTHSVAHPPHAATTMALTGTV